ncbi:hypothetical protein E8E13_001920 [Curvularia kusanoi]|uniref:F-box domain-containing protein n=1 Tax=Curvularia kusanoi TaxID=90978 RepID=A0A9P4WDD8_CURKU|nr:hypothetical protein E8E13_001920 [Curvularia kusanoi]
MSNPSNVPTSIATFVLSALLTVPQQQDMGYSEIACRLCGVSFNIGRRRLRSEPEWMGWENTGDGVRVGCQWGQDRDGNWYGNDDPSEEEDEASASEGVCEDLNGVDIDRIAADDEQMQDSGDDDDYQYEESDGEEAMEYDSDNEMWNPEEIGHVDIVAAVEDDDTYTSFKHTISSDPPPKHDCFRGKGYNGKYITAQEMRGCNTAQCLLSKIYYSPDADDDQEFERQSSFFLSGLCGNVKSRDGGGEEFLPSRHGLEYVNVDSWFVEDDTAIPFHPTCFDIFCRLSRKHFGHIDLEALGKWIFDPHNHLDAKGVSSDPNVSSCSDQWWDHRDGCEYLSANPLLIPRLAPILQAAIEKDDVFDPCDGAFDVPTGDDFGDAFSCLPLELRLQILSYLTSSDIANLRLTSRTFRQLPILLWRDLLISEMPYLWEVWSDDLPFIWATVQFEDVKQHLKVQEESATWYATTEETIREDLPEALNAWKQHVKSYLPEKFDMFLEKQRAEALKEIVTGLPASKTNWYKVYTEIRRNWKDLKGLQNRKRIWKDIGLIVDRLEQPTVPA